MDWTIGDIGAMVDVYFTLIELNGTIRAAA